MTYPRSPRLIKGGIVLVDPTSGAIRRVIALQYNPDTLTRTLAVQAAGGEGGDRLKAMRLKGPSTETIKLEAEIDSTDRMELAGEGRRMTAPAAVPPCDRSLAAALGLPSGGTRLPTEALNFDAREAARP